MSQNKKSHYSQFSLTPLASLTPIAAAVSAAIVGPVDAVAQDESDSILEEVIVTGTKMEANIQHIAFDIQALPESMLRDMGAQVTEDYARFVPAMNWLNYNPGGSNFLVFRGINTTVGGFTQTQSSSIYLDEIPITATDGTQPDIRMMDIERVEALAGPQGTLFGAAAQAGILRIITNKPDTSMFDANAEVMLRTGEESDPSYQGTAMLNLPLVKDKFAIRIAAQFAEDGGFVDNVPGHTPDTWWGEHRDEADWGVNRQGWGTYRNDVTAEENWNSATSLAIRISARWDINENWRATLTYHDGDTKSEGNNAYNPFVGDLETIGFVKNTSHSEWDMTGLVIEADYDFGQFVSATSFYENQRTYAIDNTLYYKYYNTSSYCEDGGEFIPGYYWWWENNTTGRAIYAPIYCVTPAVGDPLLGTTQIPDMAGVGRGPEWQERFTQEFRFSHQGETIDWLAGLYYEDSKDAWNSVWMADAFRPYNESMSHAFLLDCATAAPGSDTAKSWQCRGAMGTPPRGNEMAEALAIADHYWDSRDDTDWETKAIFGELTWHATEKLDLVFGGRWFETKNTKTYTKMIAGYTQANRRAAGGFIQNRWKGNEVPQTSKLDEFVPKISASYQIDNDKMIYALYSEGYRVGGVNRANKNADWDRTLFGQVYEPDRLKNYELGFRSRWAQSTVQWNITYFYMDWEDFQHQVVDPSSGACIDPAEEPDCAPADQLPWISIVGNIGDAHSTGITTSVDWVPAERWIIGANAQWIEAEIDSVNADDRTTVTTGRQLPNTPEFQGSAWATFTWPVEFVASGEMFLRGQYSYTGKTHTLLNPAGLDTVNPDFTNDAYSLLDLRLGLVSGKWSVDLFVNNVTDERAQITQGSTSYEWQWGRTGEYEHWHNVYTVRPREYGIRFYTRF